MPHSHHSHSGQFCGHAKDRLEEVVQKAISAKMRVFCMTEHMPRDRDEDLYAEEVEAGVTPADLRATFNAYMQEARQLQEKYKSEIRILVGMETDWIQPETCRPSIMNLFSSFQFDMFVGSVHHVHTVPIDISKELFQKAVSISVEQTGGLEADGEAALASDYFDLQMSMLEALKPPVVGHFDLIRLLADFEKGGQSLKEWPQVWRKVLRNLYFVNGYGGCLEINSAGLRKGLRDPYPCKDVCKAFLEIGGRFVLSDDSHGIEQVGHSYRGVIDFLDAVGISEVAVFNHLPESSDERFPAAATQRQSVRELKTSGFMKDHL